MIFLARQYGFTTRGYLLVDIAGLENVIDSHRWRQKISTILERKLMGIARLDMILGVELC